jgi:DNA-binding MurR/RpiR family transcriptional regulator
MSAGPASYPELRKQLQASYETLAPGQRRIARILLSDPESCAFWTVSDMARAAEVHESSAVRFATGLGLSGFPALVELCRRQLTEQAQLIGRFERVRELAESDDLLSAAAVADQQDIARTFGRIDEKAWSAAVTMLAKAPSIHVLGLRKCYSVANLFAYLLHLVRKDVFQVGTGSASLVDELRDVSKGDAFVAISIHRYTSDTVMAMEYAASRGLSTLALTDNAASPLAKTADHVFYIDTTGPMILRSVTAFTAITQALATAVAVELGTSSRDELLQDETLLSAFSVYHENNQTRPSAPTKDQRPANGASRRKRTTKSK